MTPRGWRQCALARPDARLRVDANAGWTADEAIATLRVLEQYDLELIEQPTAKDDIAGMGRVQAHTALPVVADESVRTLADVEALAAVGVRGINLKLMKVGGLTPALAHSGAGAGVGAARDVGLHDRDFAWHDGRGSPHGPRGLGGSGRAAPGER